MFVSQGICRSFMAINQDISYIQTLWSIDFVAHFRKSV